MALTVTSVTPNNVEALPGTPLVLNGTFELGKVYEVYIGPVGDATDPVALSGRIGAMKTCITKLTTQLKCYLPRLDPGTYKVFVDDGTSTATLNSAITVRAANFRSSVFSLRAPLAPRLYVGPRNPEGVL